jgi:hypothetical protein
MAKTRRPSKLQELFGTERYVDRSEAISPAGSYAGRPGM